MLMSCLRRCRRQPANTFMTAITHRYQSDFARRYFADGEAKGKAEGKALAVLAVLQARGVEVGAVDRDQIIGCTHQDQLDSWVLRAANATTIHDVLDEAAEFITL
jgi:hypothetical protein